MTSEARSRSSLSRLTAAALLTTALVAGGAIGGRLAGAADVPPPANAAVANLTYADIGYARLVEAVKPAVVNVQVERTEGGGVQQRSPMDDPEMRRFFERFFGQLPDGAQPRPPRPERVQGQGSGFIIDPEGFIVTNAHVAGGASKVEILMQDETRYPATIVGVDEKTDLAVLKVDAGKPLPYVTFGDSAVMRPGDKVVAVGNPFGLGGTVTSGIVSATGREIGSGPYDDFLQIDAAINRGNSGGPTFNLKGEVVGVNSAIFSPNGGSIGIGFAISSNLAKAIVADLKDDGTIERGWLGVGIQPVDEDLARGLDLANAKGALVNDVQDGSPAAAGGVQRGDVVLGLNGRAIDEPRQLSRAVADLEPGKPAELRVWRDGQERTLEVTLGEMPQSPQVAAVEPAEEPGQPRLGLSLAQLDGEARTRLQIPDTQRGVVIAEVDDGGPAAEKGIQPGDVILSVDRQPVGNPREVSQAVRKASQEGEKSVMLLLWREGRQFFEAVPLAVS